ncbi:hypothetical protein [Leptospira yasudae]|nr:hypothetical protein [Leptospira yasudae]
MLPSAIVSERLSQSKLREKFPFAISFGVTQNGQFSLDTVSLAYNRNSNLSIGMNFHYTIRKVGIDYYDNFTVLCSPDESHSDISNCKEYKNLSNLSGDIFFNYFPFSGIFFVSAHFGLLPNEVRKVSYDNYASYEYFNLNTSTLSYTAERKNTVFSALGGGFRWEFVPGFILKVESGFLQIIRSDDSLYAYSDNRGLLPGSRPSSLKEIELLKRTMIKGPDDLDFFLNLSFGNTL